ncbi:MAG: regulatory iron-sulfur-containing complex subunit RicT [Bacteroidota bacterium]
MGCSSCSVGGSCGAGCGGNGGCGSSTGRAGTSACPAMHVFDWLTDMSIGAPTEVFDLVEVVFKGGRKGIYQNTQRLDIYTGDFVVVAADRGVDFGSVNMTGELVRMRLRTHGTSDDEEFPNLVRRATLTDMEQAETNKEREAETFLIGRQTIDRMDLPMKLVDVEWQFDSKKVTFYFTADNRVDFRQLVRELARRFKTRVELRQIGARDEAARLGGIGSCGRELCCSTWLEEFKPVTTNAARIQNLPLNPVRLSGQCGRLKCCLNYELEQYMGMLQYFPEVNTRVRTTHGEGRIRKVDIFRDTVAVSHRDGTWEDLPLAEVRVALGVDAGHTFRTFQYKPPTASHQGRRKPRPAQKRG